MRAFIAIPLSGECRRAIDEAVSPLRSGGEAVSWVPEGNLHLTLKFLGEIPSGRIGELGDLMLAGARDIPPFEIRVCEAGGFPSLRMPRVLWIGIREPLELVRKLHQNMENELSRAGFPRDEKPFHPHVTIARIRGRTAPGWPDAFAAAVSGMAVCAVPVTSYRLYESRLSPSGARYSVLREVPMGGGTGGKIRGGAGE